MKLEEFVKKIYDEKLDLGMTPSFGPILNSKELEEVKDELLKFDVFSECDDLEIVHYPTFKLGEDKTLTTQTFKYEEGIKFKGKCYLYSISLTPVMYNPNQLIKPVKNGAAIGPVVYDPITFEPRKHILLTWLPEMVQDIYNIDTEQEQRQIIHKLLDDVFDNPKEYETKGKREVLIRGVFEVVNDERKFEPNYLVGSTQESDTFTGYYMVTENESLVIKTKRIPKTLNELFILNFTGDGKLKETTEEEINQFLEENK